MAALTLEELREQEAENRFASFDFADAWALGSLIRTRAVALQAPVAIEVYAFGQTLFLSALPGSSADNLQWMKRKRNTVLRMAHSSLYMGLIYQAEGARMDKMAHIDQAHYCDHGGSFPLLSRQGSVLGAVSVSGLPSVEDHALALWGIQHMLIAERA